MNWDINLTTPTGTTGHLVVDSDADNETLTKQIADWIISVREHDHPQIEGKAGISPAAQERKMARS